MGGLPDLACINLLVISRCSAIIIAMIKILAAMLTLAAIHAQTRQVSTEEVMRVHQSALLIDTHNDVTSFTVDGMDIGKEQSKRHTDLLKLKQGGVGAVFFAVYVGSSYVEGNHAAHRTLEMIDTVRHDIAARYPGDFSLAITAAEIESARKNGKIAVLLGIEGGHAIEDSLRLLRTYYSLGVRYMTLTHSNSNNWADSSGDAGKHKGLTPFGKQVVAEMNRLGMMVDISHVADKTFYDVLAASRAPIFASHSSCKAISPIARNMTDAMIRALAEKGGVIQINFGCEFVSAKSADTSTWTNMARRSAVDAELAKLGNLTRQRREEESEAIAKRLGFQTTPATLTDVVAQIEHVIRIAGADHVGIGSDFDGVNCVPLGLDDVSKFPALTRVLLERGHTAEEIRKIYGGNLLRVMRAVEKAAQQ